MVRARASLPDERAELAKLSEAYGPIRAVAKEYGGPALVVRPANVVWREAGAGTPNLVWRHGRISDGSGILFEKKI